MISKIDKIVRAADRLLGYLVIIFFLVVLLICSYSIYDAVSIHNEVKKLSEVSKLVESVPDDSRIDELKKTNPDIQAWIILDDTEINYPVLQTSNNQYYLNHDYRKEYSIAGSIFADYRSDLMSDDYAVIYGHNMDGKAMFGHINDFESADFFSRHKTGRLFLSDGSVKDLSVVAYAQIEDNEQVGYNVDAYSKGKNDDILEHFKAVAINSDFSHNHERLLLLSTCYQHSSRRAVLLVGYDN